MAFAFCLWIVTLTVATDHLQQHLSHVKRLERKKGMTLTKCFLGGGGIEYGHRLQIREEMLGVGWSNVPALLDVLAQGRVQRNVKQCSSIQSRRSQSEGTVHMNLLWSKN